MLGRRGFLGGLLGAAGAAVTPKAEPDKKTVFYTAPCGYCKRQFPVMAPPTTLVLCDICTRQTIILDPVEALEECGRLNLEDIGDDTMNAAKKDIKRLKEKKG